METFLICDADSYGMLSLSPHLQAHGGVFVTFHGLFCWKSLLQGKETQVALHTDRVTSPRALVTRDWSLCSCWSQGINSGDCRRGNSVLGIHSLLNALETGPQIKLIWKFIKSNIKISPCFLNEETVSRVEMFLVFKATVCVLYLPTVSRHLPLGLMKRHYSLPGL